jgi:hypothetical protein
MSHADDQLTALLLVRVPGPHAGRRLAGWLKAGKRGFGVLVLDNREAAAEVVRLRQLVEGLADRVARQSELLARRAERARGPVDDGGRT